jgi:hypothetical protein
MSDRIFMGVVIATPYRMVPSLAPGNCAGCLLFNEGAYPVACHLSGCQPRENPEGAGYRTVAEIIDQSMFDEAMEVQV